MTDLSVSPFWQFVMWLIDKFSKKEEITEEEKQELIKFLESKGFIFEKEMEVEK